MAGRNIVDEEGSTKCIRFGDGTPPLCHVSDQLGHRCQPCTQENRAAQATFEGSTPQARHELLRRENLNLRLANTFTSMEYEAEKRITEVWHLAVTAKIAERDAIIRHRDQAE